MYGGTTMPSGAASKMGTGSGGGTAFGTPHSAYGACEELPYSQQDYGTLQKEQIRRAGQLAPRTNLAAFLTCLFLPCAVFAAVFSLESFSMHYTEPATVRLLVVMIGIVVLALAFFASCVWLLRPGWSLDPRWCTFLFATTALAWAAGWASGNQNFVANTAPFMDVQNLNFYPNLDPSTTLGNQVMDAGVIRFAEGSYVEVKKSMGFKNQNVYCVAPIMSRSAAGAAHAASPASGNGTASNATSAVQYDFWAVGINCCSGQFPDFHCGEFADPKARSGLRLVGDDVKAYFRLALEQAEAAFKIKAKHPVFVQWLRDPAHEVHAYQEAAWTFWVSGVLIFIAVQLFLVVAAAVAFSKFCV